MGLMQSIASFLAFLISALALAWTMIAFRLNKQNALALERTKFIFENLRFFETDQLLQMAFQIMNGFIKDFTIDTFLKLMDEEEENGTPEQLTKCMALNNYLNFLYRVAYAHFALKTITPDDLDAFGYYYYLVSEHEGLMRYCVSEGFEEVVDAINKLKPIWDKTEIENEQRARMIDGLVAAKIAARKAI
jgi:hypothetical protein